MTLAELKYLVYADMYRAHGKANLRILLGELVWGVTGKYLIWMRTAAWLSTRSRLWLPIYLFVRLLVRRYCIRYGLNIAYQASIGPGLSLAHFGGININARARIGRNCNISQEVTIGISNRGRWRGVPTIGDHVYIGPGAKLFGAIKVGNNVAIGANCVVVEDVPDNAVVFGVPGRVITFGGSEGYINRTDYDRILKPPRLGELAAAPPEVSPLIRPAAGTAHQDRGSHAPSPHSASPTADDRRPYADAIEAD